MNIRELRAHIDLLKQEQADLQSEGEAIFGKWIDSFTRAGKTYHRMRWHRGKGVTPGCKTIKPEEVAEVERAVERGRRLAAIESELRESQKKLARKEALLRELIGEEAS